MWCIDANKNRQIWRMQEKMTDATFSERQSF